MRIALVHDYLNQYGGGERVLEAFAEIFPDAPIYTLFYDAEKTFHRFQNRIQKTSFLDHPKIRNNHRAYIPLMPLAANFLRLKQEYDVVLSSSAGFGKGFHIPKSIPHIAYCHTPLRYAWEHYQYFDHWSPLLKNFAAPAFYYLRWWDKRNSRKPQTLLANSQYIADKMKRYYGREAEVVYPPVDLHFFAPNKKVPKDGYFLAVGRLIRYKRFDLVVEAFNKLQLPLVIVGNGPELENLKQLVRSKKIHFAPFVTDEELRILYNGAEALVFPQVEDFGLVAAEAHACGTPVIAYAEGGAKEIVEDGVTGILFHYQTVDGLTMAIKKFMLLSFDPKIIRASAQRFSKTKFKERITKIVKAAKLA